MAKKKTSESKKKSTKAKSTKAKSTKAKSKRVTELSSVRRLLNLLAEKDGPDYFRSYYENHNGDKMAILWKKGEDTGILTHTDLEKPLSLILTCNPNLPMSSPNRWMFTENKGVVFGNGECLWFQACARSIGIGHSFWKKERAAGHES